MKETWHLIKCQDKPNKDILLILSFESNEMLVSMKQSLLAMVLFDDFFLQR